MNDQKNGSVGILEQFRDKLAALVDEMKGKAAPMAEEVCEKAAPAMEKAKDFAQDAAEKIKDAAQDAADKMKEGAQKLGDMLDAEAPAPQVKNDKMEELEEKVRVQRDEVVARAEELQRALEKLMGGRKKKS